MKETAIFSYLTQGGYEIMESLIRPRRILTATQTRVGIVAVLITILMLTGHSAFSQECPKEHEHLSNPHNEGIHFIEDIKILDMTQRKDPKDATPEMRKKRYSPVIWTRISRIRKLSEEAKTAVLESATGGVALDARCLTHKYKVHEYKKIEPHRNRVLRIGRCLEVNIEDVKVNEEVSIISEMTYWNGFQGDPEEWGGMYTPKVGTERIGIILKFPDKKPIKDFKLYAYERHTDAVRFRDPNVTPSENNRLLKWFVEDPKPQYVYTIWWKW
jgi:hypothetical protein